MAGDCIARLPDTAVFSSQVSSPIIADMNGDGHKEVVTGWKIDPDSTSDAQDFNPFINDIWGSGEWGTMGESWSGGVVFLNAANGAQTYTYHFHQLVESGLALGHADASRPLSTYVLNDSDSVVCFDKTKPHGFYGSGNLHGQFGKNQRLMSGCYQQGVDVYTADIDGDGLDEVLVPTTQLNPLWQPNETILDDDGAILWRHWKKSVTFPITQWQNNACMIPVNPDHDNHVDVLSFTHSYQIAFRYWNGVELVDRPGWPKNFYPFLPTPPVVGDVDGDGEEEIIIGTYDPSQNPSSGSLYVFALNGALKFSLPVPGGLKHIPTLANIYGNGIDVIYRSLAGRVYIQNFGSTNAGPVSWATHRGNPRRDGNFGQSLFPAGTPLITRKESLWCGASFSWSAGSGTQPDRWRIYRAEQPGGPFVHVATLTGNATDYVDPQLSPGHQYIYEVAAIRGETSVRSAPFPVLSLLNSNLVSNAGFEENDNSHWDKWFTGDLDWSCMTASTAVSYQGASSMQIQLTNTAGGGSISQFGQYGTPQATMPVTAGRLYSFGGFFKSGGISQSSEHWLEWSSTVTGSNLAARPPRPYPDYFTPHFTLDTNATDWTYANRAFVMPPGFPNVELTHWYTLAAAGSGSIYLDNLFFRALPLPEATNWTELIPFGSEWRFCAGAAPARWFKAEFDDSAWPRGTAKFGAGGGPTNVATALPSQQAAYFFRRTFVLPAQPCEELLLSATCTDAGAPFDLYFNGARLETTGIDAVTGQGNIVCYYDLVPFLPMLRPGTNSIAVLLHNTAATDWDDVAFDLSVKTVISARSLAHLALRRQSGMVLNELGADVNLDISAPPNTIWRVETADSVVGPWQLLGVVTSGANGNVSVPDEGQNGRLMPSQASARFYRLVPE